MKKIALMSAGLVALLAGQALAQPVIDGTRDGSYGAPLFVQTQPTQFGNSNLAEPDLANGSEMDAVYGLVQGGKLYLFIAGNLETNFNKFDLFFDVQPGGQNNLREDNVDIDFGALKIFFKLGDHDFFFNLSFMSVIEIFFKRLKRIF